MRLSSVEDNIGAGIREENLPPPENGRIDLRGWFGEERRSLPLELEIGPGKGAFLLQAAKTFPEVNYLSVEWSKRYWKIVVKRCNSHNISNVKIVKTDVRTFIRDYTEDNLFRKVHVYFPDPWHKRKHNDRRLLQTVFFIEIYRVIEPGGIINIVTDYLDYYKWIKKHAKIVASYFETVPFEEQSSVDEGEIVGTNFERKYRKEGREFYGIALRKII